MKTEKKKRVSCRENNEARTNEVKAHEQDRKDPRTKKQAQEQEQDQSSRT